MFHLKKSTLLDTVSGINPQYFCLAAALGLEFLLMAFRGYGFYFIENYMIIPTMLFLGAAFGKKLLPVTRRQLWLALAMAVWFFIVQTLHYMMDMNVRSVGLFTSVYLLAFPFASLTQDGKKQWGLNLAAVACIGASLAMVCFTCLLSLDLLPGFLQPHIYWDGARLQAFWHPNICAIIFMMGIAFSLYMAVKVRQKWLKVLFAFLVIIFFLNMSLTNSRTSIFMASVILCGFLFFCIYNLKWKRIIIYGVVALAVIVILFLVCSTIFQIHNNMLINKYLQQAQEESISDTTTHEETPLIISTQSGEITLKTDAGQSSLLGNLPDLNGRTGLWVSSVQYIRSHPVLMFFGTDSSENLIPNYWINHLAHTHNAWIEVWMILGLPGLLFALIFTGIAAWHIWVTFWSKDTNLSQKVIAMLVMCLMGASMLEPYIFFSDIYYHYTDFIFFLCLGYLIQWRSEKNA